MTFAARDFWRRRGASDEHTRQRFVRNEQRSLRQKEPPPFGLRPIGAFANPAPVDSMMRMPGAPQPLSGHHSARSLVRCRLLSCVSAQILP